MKETDLAAQAPQLPTWKQWVGLIAVGVFWSIAIQALLHGKAAEPWVRWGGSFLLGFFWRTLCAAASQLRVRPATESSSQHISGRDS